MSAIVEIRDRIQATITRIAEYEKAARAPGAPESIFIGIRSLEKQRAALEADFTRVAKDEELEICRYRLMPAKTERPRLGAIADAWNTYQALFSSLYTAIKHGPQ